MRWVKAQCVSVLFASLMACFAPVRAQTLAIANATVIDGTGKGPLPDAVILITDGRFTAVGSAREVAVPKGAKRLDARGKYAIPGLMDAILLLFSPDLEALVKYEGRYHELVLEAAQLALKSGVTTVFDTNRPPTMVVKARDMINSGQVPGSRIYLGGHIIGMDGPLSVDFFGAAAAHVSKGFARRMNDEWEQGVGRRLLYMSPEEIRPIIREYARKVDFLKFAGSDHMPGPFICFSPRQQRAIVEEGHKAGRTVQAHIMSPEALNLVIESGVDLVTHGDMSGPTTPFPDEIIRKLVERRVAISVLPVTQRNLAAREKLVPGEFTDFVKIAKINRRNMIKAGVTMLLATETTVRSPQRLAERPTDEANLDEPSLHGQYGDQVNALVALEEEGMDRMEILKTATSNTARAYKVDADLGTIERGKLADLLLLDANPLDSARNYGTIRTVIKDGKVIDRDTLPMHPILTAKAGAAAAN